MKGRRSSAEPAHRFLSTALFLGLLGGCTGRQGPEPEPPQPAAPLVAKVSCTEAGPRVATPVVRAQSDGVHFRVTNQTNDKILFGTEAGEATGPMEPGEKAQVVATVAPGASEVQCRRPDLRLKEQKEIDVLDPEGWWIPTTLDCPAGWASSIEGTGGVSSPVGHAGQILKGLQPKDVVREAGYPQDSEAVVTVARDGSVVLVISYWRHGDTWSIQGATGCNEAGVSLDF